MTPSQLESKPLADFFDLLIEFHQQNDFEYMTVLDVVAITGLSESEVNLKFESLLEMGFYHSNEWSVDAHLLNDGTRIFQVDYQKYLDSFWHAIFMLNDWHERYGF